MSKNVIIMGAGAIGSNLVTNLSADLKDKISLVVCDYDTVEPRNYQAGTQAYFKEQNGKPKVSALALNIYRQFGVQIVPVNRKFEESGLGYFEWNFPLADNLNMLVIDCFDNFESRNLLSQFCAHRSLDCLHIGFSPQKSFEICWNKNYQVPDDANNEIEICEMVGARSFIMFVTGLAGIVVQEFLATGEKLNFVGNRVGFRSLL